MEMFASVNIHTILFCPFFKELMVVYMLLSYHVPLLYSSFSIPPPLLLIQRVEGGGGGGEANGCGLTLLVCCLRQSPQLASWMAWPFEYVSSPS